MSQPANTGHFSWTNCTSRVLLSEADLPDVQPLVWFISFLTISANTLLISVLIMNRSIGNQRQRILMLSLASTDLCVGLISPLNAYMEQRGVLFEDLFARKMFCMVLTSLEAVLLTASIYHLLALSVDRLYLIEKPFKFMELKTKKREAYQTALVCWLLAFLPAAPLWTDWDTRSNMNTDCWNICTFPYDSVPWVLFAGLTGFVIPAVIIVSIYGAIIQKLQFRSEIRCNQDESTKQRRERRITFVIGTISFAFLFCWSPYFVFSMYWLCRSEQNKMFHRDILMPLVSLGYINSLVNPVLYITINKDIRTIIYNVITGQKEQSSSLRTATLGRSKTSQSPTSEVSSTSLKHDTTQTTTPSDQTPPEAIT